MATHGSKSKLEIDGFMLSDYQTTIGLTGGRDSSEVTTFGVGSKQYIPGLKDATVPFGGPFDEVVNDFLFELLNQEETVTFKYMPAGVDSIYYTGQCFIISVEVASDVGDPNALTGEFQVTGDVERVDEGDLPVFPSDFNSDDGEFWDFNSDDPNDVFFEGNELTDA